MVLYQFQQVQHSDDNSKKNRNWILILVGVAASAIFMLATYGDVEAVSEMALQHTQPWIKAMSLGAELMTSYVSSDMETVDNIQSILGRTLNIKSWKHITKQEQRTLRKQFAVMKLEMQDKGSVRDSIKSVVDTFINIVDSNVEIDDSVVCDFHKIVLEEFDNADEQNKADIFNELMKLPKQLKKEI